MRPLISPSSVICFSVYEADLGARELRKNGVKVKIQELPFRALELLLNRPGEVLTREEFRHALWPDGVFVDFDHGLSSAAFRTTRRSPCLSTSSIATPVRKHSRRS